MHCDQRLAGIERGRARQHGQLGYTFRLRTHGDDAHPLKTKPGSWSRFSHLAGALADENLISLGSRGTRLFLWSQVQPGDSSSDHKYGFVIRGSGFAKFLENHFGFNARSSLH